MSQRPIIPFPQRATEGQTLSKERRLPQSLESEQSTLGAMLIEREAVARAVELLTVDDFYREFHKNIYEAIYHLFKSEEPTDIESVAAELRRTEQLEDVGGREYLLVLIETCPSATSIQSYARVVSEKSIRRQLIEASEAIANLACNSGQEFSEIISRSRHLMAQIGRRQRQNGFTPIGSLLSPAYDTIERQFQRQSAVSGVSTSYVDLDAITNGLQPGELTILAGRPWMGKTSLSLSIAHHIAVQEEKPVAVFSLEMSKEQIVQRLICSQASVSVPDLRHNQVQDSDMGRITQAVNALNQAPIFIDDQSPQSIEGMREKIRRLTSQYRQFGMIVVDYLQLIQSGSQDDVRPQDISIITRGLKEMARECKCPIIALSPLSRDVETREDKRPRLSDLRESGSIENEADVVLLVYRPSYYQQKLGSSPSESGLDEGIVEIIVAKHRHGPTGTIRLGFQAEYGRFSNLVSRDDEDPESN